MDDDALLAYVDAGLNETKAAREICEISRHAVAVARTITSKAEEEVYAAQIKAQQLLDAILREQKTLQESEQDEKTINILAGKTSQALSLCSFPYASDALSPVNVERLLSTVEIAQRVVPVDERVELLEAANSASVNMAEALCSSIHKRYQSHDVDLDLDAHVDITTGISTETEAQDEDKFLGTLISPLKALHICSRLETEGALVGKNNVPHKLKFVASLRKCVKCYIEVRSPVILQRCYNMRESPERVHRCLSSALNVFVKLFPPSSVGLCKVYDAVVAEYASKYQPKKKISVGKLRSRYLDIGVWTPDEALRNFVLSIKPLFGVCPKESFGEHTIDCVETFVSHILTLELRERRGA